MDDTPSLDAIGGWPALLSSLLERNDLPASHARAAMTTILEGDATAAQPNDAAHRVAEGGFEHVALWRAADLPALIGQLRSAGGEVIGAATRGGAIRPGGAPSARSLRAVVLGNEEHGLSAATAAACAQCVTLPGSGRVESLNVSVAAALMIWEYLRPYK